MSRLIDADSVINEISRFSGYLDDDMILRLQIAIKRLSTIDAAPVVHGRWIERTDYVGDAYYDCSACGESWTTIEGDPWDNGMDYCPKCGAKMDEVTE